MATFTNQATLTYNGQSTVSNITTGELLDALGMTKTAVNTTYGRNNNITYAISISNTGTVPFTNATITDDLGSYTVGTTTVTPLTYVDGSVRYYQNGVLQTAPAVTPGAPLIISGLTVPAGGNVLVLYEAETNEFTPLIAGSSITNTATVTADGLAETLTDTAVVTAADDTNLTIAKAISPAVVNDNGTLTYTFIIQNSGNTEVTADGGLIVSDLFNPILNPITVTYNGTTWTEGTEYTYDATTGQFTTVAGSITVPAATYTQDAATGVYSTAPGVAVITVTGTV